MEQVQNREEKGIKTRSRGINRMHALDKHSDLYLSGLDRGMQSHMWSLTSLSRQACDECVKETVSPALQTCTGLHFLYESLLLLPALHLISGAFSAQDSVFFPDEIPRCVDKPRIFWFHAKLPLQWREQLTAPGLVPPLLYRVPRWTWSHFQFCRSVQYCSIGTDLLQHEPTFIGQLLTKWSAI